MTGNWGNKAKFNYPGAANPTRSSRCYAGRYRRRVWPGLLSYAYEHIHKTSLPELPGFTDGARATKTVGCV
jgi:hypothetical protein